MARDSGRYDAITDTWIDQNVRIDFAWGNIPIQPNDDRGENELVYELDSHNIAIDGYGNYPNAPIAGLVAVPLVPMPCTVEQYIDLLTAAGLVFDGAESVVNTVGSQLNGQVTQTYPSAGTLVSPGTAVAVDYYANYVVNATVPDVRGLAWPAANTAITNAGFTVGNTSEQTITGATSENTNYVATQTPTAGSQAPQGSAINYVTYAPLSTATTGSISGINRNAAAVDGSLNGDQAVLYVTGRDNWPTVGSVITISGTANSTYNQNATVVLVKYDDSFNTGGTAIKITFDGAWSGTELSLGGTWTKVVPFLVPDLTGLTASQANAALAAVGLVGAQGNSWGGQYGANSNNNGTVGGQDNSPGTVLTAGATVTYNLFAFVGPSTVAAATTAWWAEGFGTYVYIENVSAGSLGSIVSDPSSYQLDWSQYGTFYLTSAAYDVPSSTLRVSVAGYMGNQIGGDTGYTHGATSTTHPTDQGSLQISGTMRVFS